MSRSSLKILFLFLVRLPSEIFRLVIELLSGDHLNGLQIRVVIIFHLLHHLAYDHRLYELMVFCAHDGCPRWSIPFHSLKNFNDLICVEGPCLLYRLCIQYHSLIGVPDLFYRIGTARLLVERFF